MIVYKFILDMKTRSRLVRWDQNLYINARRDSKNREFSCLVYTNEYFILMYIP
jgi:hypothetical protein